MTEAAERPEYGLPPETVRRIREVLARHPEVEEAILYGSRAKGTHRPGSDIDLAIKGETIGLEQLNRIANELDDLLLPYRIDLSILHHIDNPELLEHIERVGRILYSHGRD